MSRGALRGRLKGSGKRPPPPPILQLKVTLLESEPIIFRRLLVPADARLGWLHLVIQDAMGWTNSHLHLFVVGEQRYSDLAFALEGTEDELAVTLGEVAPVAGSVLVYDYDFGDNWRHELLVEAVTQPEPGHPYPFCRDGSRACPPEDCGGIVGYERSLGRPGQGGRRRLHRPAHGALWLLASGERRHPPWGA